MSHGSDRKGSFTTFLVFALSKVITKKIVKFDPSTKIDSFKVEMTHGYLLFGFYVIAPENVLFFEKWLAKQLKSTVSPTHQQTFTFAAEL